MTPVALQPSATGQVHDDPHRDGHDARDGSGARTSGGRGLDGVRSRVRPVIVLTCWLYLYALLWLAAWTLIAVVFAGWSPVVVTSDSMTPLIRSGDLVLLDQHASDLDQGTVIAFERDDELVTHRIVDVWADGSYRTRGDANNGPDAEPVDPADVVGNGRLLVPVIGAPLAWMEQGRVLLALAWFSLTIGAIVVATTATPRFRSRTVRREGTEPRGTSR